MTAIIVGGKQLAAPDVFSVGRETVGSFERNANGNLVGDLVAVKTVLNAGWKMMDDAAFKEILKHAEPFFVDVEYYDPKAGQMVQKKMYTRPGGASVALNARGQMWWRDVRCVFVER